MDTNTNLGLTPLENGSFSINSSTNGTGLKFNEEWTSIETNVMENIRMMATRIRKTVEFPKTLGVTSTLSGEGVSSVCVGLGVTLAHDYEAKTCIVDLNWYFPSKLYPRVQNGCGIADVVYGDTRLEDAVRPFGVKDLYYLSSGDLDASRLPIIARSKRLAQLLKKLEGMFDHLVLDLPAVLITSDTVHLAALAHNCCLVIQQGVTPTHDVKLALDEINHLNILGVVLNRVNIATPDKLLKLLTE